MKTKLLIFMMAIGLAFSACNGKQADQENADEMNQYTDSTTHKDSLSADTTHDKTTNAPADAGTEKK
ncbi:MAG: hypothetical protein EOO20_00185 [Chryseobacterium sp.]|nr:MAG: hypothetical protein EOO20_00185 [Chryseobacterium sp.]